MNNDKCVTKIMPNWVMRVDDTLTTVHVLGITKYVLNYK